MSLYWGYGCLVLIKLKAEEVLYCHLILNKQLCVSKKRKKNHLVIMRHLSILTLLFSKVLMASNTMRCKEKTKKNTKKNRNIHISLILMLNLIQYIQSHCEHCNTWYYIIRASGDFLFGNVKDVWPMHVTTIFCFLWMCSINPNEALGYLLSLRTWSNCRFESFNQTSVYFKLK